MATVDNNELVELGAGMEIPEDIATDKVWAVLLVKIKQPNLFLPVTDVVTRPCEDGVGTYREMSMGPTRIIEHIYYDENILEVNFNVTNDEDEHVNIILVDKDTGKRTLEFFKRNSTTKERVQWDVPKHIALAGIVKIFDMARTI
jgi:hypothetical protein